MFRIEFFVDEKKLGAALLALVGLAHGQPSVQPVVNAVKTGNGLVAISSGKGSDRAAQALGRIKKGTELDGAQLREAFKSVGIKPNSVGYYANLAAEAGLLKKTGKTANTRYVVI